MCGAGGACVLQASRDVAAQQRDLARSIDARTREGYARGFGTSLDLVLSAQALIHRALLRGREIALDDLLPGVLEPSEEEMRRMDWRRGGDEDARQQEGSFDDAVVVPMKAARAHLIERLSEISKPFRR